MIHSDEVKAIAQAMNVKKELVACVLSHIGLPLSFNSTKEENDTKVQIESLLKRTHDQKE